MQDYHFALLPRMIKEARPDARVAIFWHIPWPNPEAFGICPWQRELLDGLLGADLIGFHMQSHCNNFLDTVDRTLESRIDREQLRGEVAADMFTCVRPFPISVSFPNGDEQSAESELARGARRACCGSWAWKRRCWAWASIGSITPKAFRSGSARMELFFEKCPLYRRPIYVCADRCAQPDAHSAGIRI